eukprot:gnl/TRDRNA2_/TRDRNA2_173548_c0_seq1.p1 gnl/TRDRNA2_/TRDRNA2_173548_c0~~gnl/TRDRNA2_/TRDRNA2_173548_c0_seq1.p1  ORF type:complete len:706 (-),score=232.57 gnl/TRDRNA2_/TRDRNA2_173548_c0_seq1:172-2289(-)
MQAAAVLVVLALAATAGAVSTASPINKVLQMLEDLEAKVKREGEAAQKEFDKYSMWCKTQSEKLEFEIKSGKQHVEQLQALIEKDTSQITICITQIEDYTALIAKLEKELEEATAIRDKDAADFAEEEHELMNIIDTLERAIAIMEREQSKHDGASMLQTELKRASSLTEALKIMVQASAFTAADASKISSLLQSSHKSDDEDDMELGAPAGAAYEFKSGGIIETMEGLLEKAKDQLSELRKTEQDDIHAFEMLCLSLTNQIANAKEVISKSKTTRAESTHESSSAQGELSVAQTDLAEDIKMLQELHAECISFASDFEQDMKERGEELKAIRQAKTIIEETTGGAESHVYDSSLSQISFAQIASSSHRGRLSSGLGVANFEVVRFIRDLARKQSSPALAQLAARITSAMNTGNGEGKVFDKVIGLIRDLIAKLEAEQEKDKTLYAWCQKETASATAKKEKKSAVVEELQTKLDQLKADSAKLKGQVAELQQELADLAKSQVEMDKMRAEEQANFATTKEDLEKGIDGVRLALKALRDFYDNEEGSAQGASTGIISLLEVCESDFTKALQELKAEEARAKQAYDEQTAENEAARAAKQNEIKFNTKEYLHMDQTAKETASDLDNERAELDAVLAALAKINDMCIAKPEPYEERKRRRDAEIAGLKEALDILNNEAALIQKTAKHARRHERRALRGEVLEAAAVAA